MADGTTDKTAIRAEDWHTDDLYFAVPAKATLLHGIEIPSRGGSTWFCNMHSVYEALPDDAAPAHRRPTRDPRLRHAARPQPALGAHAAGDRRDARCRASAGADPSGDRPQGALSQSQPASTGSSGWSGPRATRLLDELADEARKPQHHYGHVWSVGDVVVWDNRATMHRVMIDYPLGEKRIMQRVLIEGERPV